MSRTKTTAALTLSILAVCVVLAAGQNWFWRFGPDPDLGSVAFDTLQRRSTPNDALACPAALCSARSDITTPVYRIPVQQLQTAFATVVTSETRVVRVAYDAATMTGRYVQRTKWLGFPDTIVVRFLANPDMTSTLALYSRSQFGEGDLGVNRARIERWLAKLSAIAESR